MLGDTPRAVIPSLRVWIMAARPVTLVAAAVPVLVGTSAAAHDGWFRLLPCLAALGAACLIQIGTNLANDLFDFQKGADAAGRIGPTRVTQGGLIPPSRVRRAMMLSFGGAAAIGLYLVAIGGWPILLIGIAAIVAGIAYTAGPWPLGYHGLGDIFTFAFFGPVAVIGCYYLQTETVTGLVIAMGVTVGLTVTAILVVNNLRDRESDRLAGKRTLAVRLGSRLTRIQYAALVLIPYGVVAGIAVAASRWWLLLAILTIPIALHLASTVLRDADGRRLNEVLKGTAQLHLLLGALLAVGILP